MALTRGTGSRMAVQTTTISGEVVDIPAFVAVDASGTASGQASYQLATNQTLAASANTTSTPNVNGGSYIWAYQLSGTSPSLILESLGPDGTNYQTIATVTASGAQGVVLGANATVRLRNGTANPITALSSSLS